MADMVTPTGENEGRNGVRNGGLEGAQHGGHEGFGDDSKSSSPELDDEQGKSTRPRSDRDGERGAGTLLMSGLALLALMLVAVGALMLHATTAGAKAATAADLAALAAADAARGLRPGDPCSEARLTAEQHGAELTACEVGGTGRSTVVVRVVVPTHGLLPDAKGTARAGPPS